MAGLRCVEEKGVVYNPLDGRWRALVRPRRELHGLRGGAGTLDDAQLPHRLEQTLGIERLRQEIAASELPLPAFAIPVA